MIDWGHEERRASTRLERRATGVGLGIVAARLNVAKIAAAIEVSEWT
jgi:hypothetical protein